MLSQINLWAEHIAMLLDLALIVRILALKLRQTYMFITLFAALSVFYDGVQLLMGENSSEFHTVWYFSKFIYAVVLPLAAWDVFEEAKLLVDKVRRLAMSRMLTSLLFISLWGVLIAAFTGGEAGGEQSQYLLRLAVIIWIGSVTSVLAFLWVMRRGVKLNQWILPRNTSIWNLYFQLMLAIEAILCLLYLAAPFVHSGEQQLGAQVTEVCGLILQISEVAVTIWCIWKIRAIPIDATSEPINVKG